MRILVMLLAVGAGVVMATQPGAAGQRGGPTYALSVTVAGDGRATSDPSGIDCGADCAERYAPGTRVTVTGRPGPGASHTCINGCVEGSDSTTVTMDADRAVKFTFQQITPQGPQPSPQPSATASPSATATPTGFAPALAVLERRRFAVVVELSAGAAARAAVTAKVRVAGRRRGRLAPDPVSIAAGERATVRLRLKGALRRRVARALADRPQARARLRVAVAFSAGADSRTLRRSVALPR